MAIKMKICGECALAKHNGGICPVFKTAQPQDNPGCQYHTCELHPCILCGNHMTKDNQFIDITEPDNIIIYCGKCKQHISHCPTCVNSKECRFETDPSPLPKIVQQEIRQGNMITVTQVRNPERIRQTCQNGCLCFSEEFGCSRQINHCGNYKFILSKEKTE